MFVVLFCVVAVGAEVCFVVIDGAEDSLSWNGPSLSVCCESSFHCCFLFSGVSRVYFDRFWWGSTTYYYGIRGNIVGKYF